MFYYPVELTPDDNDTVMVTFPDVPEAASFGADEDQALANAADALETALNGYITDRRDIPEPSPADGRPSVGPSLLGELKLGIYRAMRDRDWKKADLARSMGVNPRQIDRLLDLGHASTVAQLEQATRVIGSRYVIDIRKATEGDKHRYRIAI